MSDYWKDFCNYYGYSYVEEEEFEDPILERLIDKFDFFAKYGKYHMTYEDFRTEIREDYTSYSYLTKIIPKYVESGDILRYGSKNKAEFVLPKYEQEYLNQKQKLDIAKLKPIARYESIIDLNVYIERLQIKVNISSNKLNLFEKIQCESQPQSNPISLVRKIKNNNSFHNYNFLYYKSGKIVIYLDFKSSPVIADLTNFKILFVNLRRMLLYPQVNCLPPSFTISQFKGHIKPFNERPKQPVNISQSQNLPELLDKLLLTSCY